MHLPLGIIQTPHTQVWNPYTMFFPTFSFRPGTRRVFLRVSSFLGVETDINLTHVGYSRLPQVSVSSLTPRGYEKTLDVSGIRFTMLCKHFAIRSQDF